MKTTIALFSILLLFLIAQSCKRVTSCGDLSDIVTTYNIADSIKSKIPYTDKDTLVFISDVGDTATLIGQGKKVSYETVSQIIHGGDCPRSSVDYYERIDHSYSGNNISLTKATYSIYKYDKFGGKPSTTSLMFSINNNAIGLTNLEYINSISWSQDSILYRGVIIYGVYLGYNTNNVLHNLYYGVIKFRDVNNKVWVLNYKS